MSPWCSTTIPRRTWGEQAERGRQPHPDGKLHLEELDVDLPDIVTYPLVEDGAQKAAVVFRSNTPAGHRGNAHRPVQLRGTGEGAVRGFRSTSGMHWRKREPCSFRNR